MIVFPAFQSIQLRRLSLAASSTIVLRIQIERACAQGRGVTGKEMVQGVEVIAHLCTMFSRSQYRK